MSEGVIHNANPRAAEVTATAVVYFGGSIEAARAVAPEGKIRFCNAKYFEGSVEAKGTIKRPDEPERPILFANVHIAPGCPNADAIREAYKAVGIEVQALEPAGKPGKPKATAKAVKSATDLGWSLKSDPADYLKKYPKGANAALAKKIVAELGG